MTEAEFGDSDEFGQLIDETATARLAYFRTLGEPDADVWMPFVNPAFQGGPAWPTRPAWQRIRCGEQTIIASSGLTDPFPDAEGPNLGFAVETAVATSDALPSDLRPTWLLELAQAISDQAAADGRFHLRHAKFGVFLFGLRLRDASDEFSNWVDETGTMGFLVGLPIPNASITFALPAGTATLLTAKLLSPAEYAYVASRGLEGGQHLAERFSQDGTHHLSSLARASVV
jgi:hypothetical protein